MQYMHGALHVTEDELGRFEHRAAYTEAPDPEELGPDDEIIQGGGYYVALRVADDGMDGGRGDADDATDMMDVEQLLQRDEEVKAELREWCYLHCDRVGADSAQKAGKRKGRLTRARKRWKRMAGCLGRARAQNLRIESFKNFGAKFARVRSGEGWGLNQMVRWGFTVWSWWTKWNKLQRAEVMEEIQE